MGQLIIIPVGAVNERFLSDLQCRVLAGFPLEGTRRGERLEPAPFHDARRNQDHSTPVLQALVARTGTPDDRVLGVASGDLFIPILTFVFGEAELGGVAAVFSTARLDPAFYGLPPDPDRLLDRAVKEARHELGHTFGLIHCREPGCVMRASTDVGEVDLKGAEFCPECRGGLE